MPKKKIKVGIFSITSCEGCQVAVIDLGRKFLELLSKIEITRFRLLEEKPGDWGKFDIVFVEGSPLTKENIEVVQELRKRTKIFVIMGSCAHTGGIYALRNYMSKDEVLKNIYPKTFKSIFNPVVETLSKFVQVDAILPGCPANPYEFLSLCKHLLSGKKWRIQEKPVCYECQLYNKTDCLLQKGEPCLGPMILGGCGAPCPAANMPCQGCRGSLKNAKWENMFKALEEKIAKTDLDKILEIFHIKGTI